MKHWTYIGITLIIANASFLEHVRAAEVSSVHPFYSQNPFEMFRIPMEAFWRKPLPEILSPVTVRLFAGSKARSLVLKNSTDFLALDHHLTGNLMISVQNQKLCVYQRGKRVMNVDKLVLRSVDDRVFEIKSRPGGAKWTRGELSISMFKGHILVVNRLGIEDYVSGILEGELGTLNLSPEVLKAQIVVARSYVLSMRGYQHHSEGYEFCDNPHCQVFSGLPMKSNANLEVALAQARGQYLSYKGRPIAAFYHHNCGGETSAVEDVWPTSARPYLKAVKEPAGSGCRTAPHSQWRVSLTKKSLTTGFQRAGWIKRGDTLESIQIIRQDRSGRVQQLLLRTRKPATKVSIDHFRHVINQYYSREILKSALFSVSVRGDTVIFNGRGWGHGVGLCQEGAMWMARHGKTYQEILQNYFPHTKLAKLS